MSLLRQAMEAVLIKTIEFSDLEGLPVTISEGIKILVDPLEGIAFAHGFHFDVDPGEYQLMH